MRPRQDHAERTATATRQTRGCRAAFHRRRARRLEADRLLPSGSDAAAAAATSHSRRASTPSMVSVAASRCFAPIADTIAQERVRELVLQAYHEHEGEHPGQVAERVSFDTCRTPLALRRPAHRSSTPSTL